MIDVRLLVAIVVAIAVPAAAARRGWHPRTLRGELLDTAWAAVGGGVLVARLVAILVDDPSSLASLRQFLQVRSGMEFWPGVAAAIVIWALEGRGESVDAVDRLADLAPFALLSYATFELSCLWRDGCFGPASPVGIAPGGTGPSEFPVGVAVAVAVAVLAVVVRRAPWSSFPRVAAAVGGVAVVRSLASFWLPAVAPGLTRPHLESIAVGVGSTIALAVAALPRKRLVSDR